jgi:tRNA pseudouridine13 synthase
MKLRRLPEDFRVDELLTAEPGDRGRFVLYRLTKRGMGTLEAVEAIRRRWNLSASQIAYGGLKDRHALTVQYLTILEGPLQALEEPNLRLEPLGRVAQPYGPRGFRGNRFALVLRDLSKEAARKAAVAADEIARDGLPNYFDDQRFGSVGFEGGFIGEAWLRGDHERALRLALAEPTASDRPETRREKAILREHWGDWPAAKARLERSHARSIVTYLADHPVDFRGAFARLRRDLRSLYFSAYQSHLWNRMLARRIERVTRPEQRVAVEFKVGTMPVHRGLDPEQVAELTAWDIPLPSARTPLDDRQPWASLARDVLAEAGLAWEDLRVRHLKDVFLSKGSRPALVFPAGLVCRETADDLYPGRRKLDVSFELPKGAYATLLVKRLTDAA